MKRRRVLSRFLTFCLTMICIFGIMIQQMESCQAREQLLDIEFEGEVDLELNVGARIDPEMFSVKALIIDTETYDAEEIILDPEEYTVSPRYMQSERQEVTIRYRLNGVTKTITCMIKAPVNESLVEKRELLSISATYEGEPLTIGSNVMRKDVVVKATIKTTYKTGKVSTYEEELSDKDPWTMSSSVIEDGPNNIVIIYTYIDEKNSKTYKKSTTIVVNSTTAEGNWVKEGNSWRFRYVDETYKVGAWEKTGDKWYYLDEHGYMVSNQFMELDEVTYYFKEDGAMATDWTKYKGDWYYFDSEGALWKDGWFYIRGKWYYLKESGAMVTGWKFDKGKWYYLDKGNGQMKTGWVFDNVTWYYTDKDGALMESCWIKSPSGKWYYLDVGGAMRVNTWVGNYYVDQTGAWTETKEIE